MFEVLRIFVAWVKERGWKQVAGFTLLVPLPFLAAVIINREAVGFELTDNASWETREL